LVFWKKPEVARCIAGEYSEIVAQNAMFGGHAMIRRLFGVGLLGAILFLGATSTVLAQPNHNSPAHGFAGPSPPPPPPPPTPPPPPNPTPPYVISFGAGQSMITPAAKVVLKQAADNISSNAATAADYAVQVKQYYAMLGSPDQAPPVSQTTAMYTAKVSVVGYARTSHPVTYDRRLALRRAQAAAGALERMGVKRAAITVTAKAKAAPAAPSADPMTQHPQNGVAVLVTY